MADTITYPDGGYGIAPADAFNKYQRWQNQRKATTGISAPYADTKAFWEGTMDSAAKNSSARAMQNLENRRLDSTVDYQNRQLEKQDEATKRGIYSGLAAIPMTYLMYDALGVGRKEDEIAAIPSLIKKIKNWWEPETTSNQLSMYEGGNMPSFNLAGATRPIDTGIPSYSNLRDTTSFTNDFMSRYLNPEVAENVTPMVVAEAGNYMGSYTIPEAGSYADTINTSFNMQGEEGVTDFDWTAFTDLVGGV
jgi:hypothetical protein